MTLVETDIRLRQVKEAIYKEEQIFLKTDGL